MTNDLSRRVVRLEHLHRGSRLPPRELEELARRIEDARGRVIAERGCMPLPTAHAAKRAAALAAILGARS